ncbi:unnamed protein product [Prorocentrum cordatum]|uniref:RNA helicase n=1 Tax=Prorocentrum cordatum TaxID=2364126 RepID=A0ABN9WC76_9DINO|nr:unnamed protein product [Polarella glacialis]
MGGKGKGGKRRGGGGLGGEGGGDGGGERPAAALVIGGPPGDNGVKGKGGGRGKGGGDGRAPRQGKGRARGDAGGEDDAEGPRQRLWAWATQVLQREPTEEELSLRMEETPVPAGGRGRPTFQCTVVVQLPPEVGAGLATRPQGPVQGRPAPRKRDAAASAVQAVLHGFGAAPPEAPPRGAALEGPAPGGARQVDPAKARELLLAWLVKVHRMPPELAKTQEGVAESIIQQRARGGGGSTYLCTIMVPALQLGPVSGPEPMVKRKEAIMAAYAACVAEWNIPVPPRSALSLRSIQKQEQLRSTREERAEQQKRLQKEQQERRAQQKQQAKLEAESRAKERAWGVFQERLLPQVAATVPGAADGTMRLPYPQQVTKGGSDRAEQRAVSDLGNLCNKEPSFLEGPPLFFEKSESLPGQGSVHFVAAVMKVRGGDGQKWAPVAGCAYGPKRGAAKSAAARQCVTRINVKASLPVAAEMADELATLQQALAAEGRDFASVSEVWAEITQAVSEIRKLEQKGAGGLRLFVAETLESGSAGDPLSGSFRCLLTGRVPQENGLRDFRGASPSGRRSARLAVAAACQDAVARLSVLFGGGDVTTWLRRMAITPMELEELPRETIHNLRQCESHSWGTAEEVKRKLEEWMQHRTRYRQQASVAPDLSAPAPAVADLYEAPPGDGKDDPREKAKRERGVPLLPVRSLRRPLAKIMSEESVLVVSGGTGSGKSTQLPQYILDDWVGAPAPEVEEGAAAPPAPRSRRPRVCVTQPRRIAAISVAERVAFERGEEIGQSVGYTVRNDAKPPRRGDGSIEFCTVGILLRRLMDPRDPDLSRYTHLLVDEVHERDLMTDFLLILLKELLVRRGDIRVILMSATLDVSTFTGYFWDCSCLEVPSGPRYPVEEVYLEDLIYDPQWEAAQRQQQLQQQLQLQSQPQEHVSHDIANLAQLLLRKEETCRNAFAAERAEAAAEREGEKALAGVAEAADGDPDADPDVAEGGGEDGGFQGATTGLWWGSFEDGDALMDLCARLLLHIVFRGESEAGGIFDEKGKPGSILVFMPGWAEIKLVMEKLQQSPHIDRLWVLPLHSTLPKEDQQKIFQHPPPGKTKIIIGTNIAESSVTIDDVLIVVDAGLMRELSYDPVRRISTLETVWVSQSSSIQRKGRAGRVRNGRCYRLFSRAQFDGTAWRTAPEMQRCELSATCLQALAMNREVRDFLSRAPDPPARPSVESALKELVQLGAVAPPPRVPQGVLRERMLPLGETLSRMPLSPFLGRMLIMGVLFQCVDTACLLAAVIAAARRPFVSPPGKRKESLGYQRGFDSTSDLLACYAAAEVFEEKVEMQRTRGLNLQPGEAPDTADRFAAERFLVPQRVRTLLRSRDSLKEELVRARLIDRTAAHMRPHLFPKDNGDGDDADVGGWGAWDEHEGGDHGGYNRGGYWGRNSMENWNNPEWMALHAHDDEPEMRKALLVAASPVNVALRRRPFLAKHRTPTGLEAIVAPQSVNAQARVGKGGGGKDMDRRGGPSWWAYGSMQISNKQGFLRTTTLVDPYHIMLFGGLSVERQQRPGHGKGAKGKGKQAAEDDGDDGFAVEGLDGGGPVAVIDDWIELQGQEESIRLLSLLRSEMRRCIHLKVLDPKAPLPEASQWMLDEAVTGVLRTATRRQSRLTSLLPQQLVLPPGGTHKMATHRPQGWRAEGAEGRPSEGWRSGGRPAEDWREGGGYRGKADKGGGKKGGGKGKVADASDWGARDWSNLRGSAAKGGGSTYQ